MKFQIKVLKRIIRRIFNTCINLLIKVFTTYRNFIRKKIEEESYENFRGEEKRDFKVWFFQQLKSIDDDTKLRLLPAIQYYQNHIIKRERFMMWAIFIAFLVLYCPAQVILARTSFAMADKLLDQQHFSYVQPLDSLIHPEYLDLKIPMRSSVKEQNKDIEFSYILGIFLITMTLSFHSVLKFLARYLSINVTISYTVLVLFLGFTYLLSGIQLATIQYFFINQRLVYVLTSGLLYAGSMSCVLFFFITFFVLSIYVYDKRCPDALIVDSLIRVLGKTEYRISRYGASEWESIELRKDLIDHLEEIAVYINFYLPRSFQTNDPSLNLWQQKIALQMATAVRSWKKWLYTPMPDTREHFINILSFALICAASGNWDEFPKMELENSYKATSLRGRINIIFSKLYRAALPLLLFWIFQQTPFRLQGEIENYVKLGVFGIAALTLLTEFDPNFNARVSLLKEVVDLLPIIGQGKKG